LFFGNIETLNLYHTHFKTTILKKPLKPTFEHVLLIDDEDIDNLINERLLQTSYFANNVHVRTNVPAALSYLFKVLEKGEAIPEVIFLDLHMPKYDGFHFLMEFKQLYYKYEELKDTRLVILSAFVNKYPDHMLDSYTFLVGKVNKPLREDILANIVDTIKNEVVYVNA
jgi:CheY-like chemotaxis protein